MKYWVILLLLVGVLVVVYLNSGSDSGQSGADSRRGGDNKVRLEERHGFTGETVDP